MADETRSSVTGPDRIAFLGGGVMGETVLSALVTAGRDPATIAVSEKLPERAAELHESHGVEVTSGAEAVRGAGVVFVVVKPHDVESVLREIADDVEPDAVIVSLAAGVRTETIERVLPDGVAVVRAMPNTPALVGEGMFGVSAGAVCGEEEVESIARLLSAAGEVVIVPESRQDAVTAVSGSGPAYVFYLAEAMIEGGVEAGLDRETATVLTEQTIKGAAALLVDADDEARELRRKVTSPNGTTHAAITTFDERGVAEGLRAGVAAAARRSAELSGS